MTLTKLFFGIFSLKIMALWGGVHVAEWAVSEIDTGELLNIYLYTQLPVLVGHVTSLCLQILIY